MQGFKSAPMLPNRYLSPVEFELREQVAARAA